MQPVPHDLLWLTPGARPVSRQDWPDWIEPGWLARAPLVVRRDACQSGMIPVGVRGRERHQRHAAWVPPTDIASVMTPAAIARRRPWRDRAELEAVAAIAILDDIARRLDHARLDWGIGGSVGFSLASGLDVLRADSDLDLLINAPAPLAAAQDEALAALIAAGLPVDVQIATPRGGFCYRERHRTGGRVLLKTDYGPRMCDDPWHGAP